MIRLLPFVVLSMLIFTGCTNKTMGILNVETPSNNDEYVVKVNDVVRIVRGNNNGITLDEGKYLLKVSYVGQTIMDTVVHVRGMDENSIFQARMATSVLGVASMSIVWSAAWLVVFPVAVGVLPPLITPREKTTVNVNYQGNESHRLYLLDDVYLRVKRYHPNMGITNKMGQKNIMKPSGICYDSELDVVWVQSEVDSHIYPLDMEKNTEVCLLDDVNFSCNAENKKLLEKFSCR